MSMEAIREMAPVRCSVRPLRSSTDRACRVLSKYTSAVKSLLCSHWSGTENWTRVKCGKKDHRRLLVTRQMVTILSDWALRVCSLSVPLPVKDGVDRSVTNGLAWTLGGLEGWRTEDIWKCGIGRNDVGRMDDDEDTGQSDYSSDETKLHLLNGFDSLCTPMTRRKDLLLKAMGEW